MPLRTSSGGYQKYRRLMVTTTLCWEINRLSSGDVASDFFAEPPRLPLLWVRQTQIGIKVLSNNIWKGSGGYYKSRLNCIFVDCVLAWLCMRRLRCFTGYAVLETLQCSCGWNGLNLFNCSFAQIDVAVTFSSLLLNSSRARSTFFYRDCCDTWKQPKIG